MLLLKLRSEMPNLVKKFQPVLKIFFFYLFFFFFHEHLRFLGQQGKGEALSLTTLYHFYPLYRHLGISRVITAESFPLDIATRRTPTGNLFPSASSFLAHGMHGGGDSSPTINHKIFETNSRLHVK